jgi:hypothetical protein
MTKKDCECHRHGAAALDLARDPVQILAFDELFHPRQQAPPFAAVVADDPHRTGAHQDLAQFVVLEPAQVLAQRVERAVKLLWLRKWRAVSSAMNSVRCCSRASFSWLANCWRLST